MTPQSVPGRPLSYRDAGVDIDAGDRLVEAIKPFAKRTLRPEVLAGIGGFGALIELPKRYREPVLVAGTDGVGTKLKLAFAMNKHDTIGIDLVAMSVNDILVQGAEPLFFLDYFVCETLDVAVASEVIRGIAQGCELAGCALAGGETAEHEGIRSANTISPDRRRRRRKSRAIDGRRIAAGDVLLGLASSGPHSNGFSLIRGILERGHADLAQKIAGVTGERTLGETLLEPTRIYVKPVLALLAECEVKGMAHITGGGLSENTHRMFPDTLAARIDAQSWPRPPIFDWLQREGNVATAEMYRVFNCGIGFVLVVAPEAAAAAIARFPNRARPCTRSGTVCRAPRAHPAPSSSDACLPAKHANSPDRASSRVSMDHRRGNDRIPAFAGRRSLKRPSSFLRPRLQHGRADRRDRRGDCDRDQQPARCSGARDRCRRRSRDVGRRSSRLRRPRRVRALFAAAIDAKRPTWSSSRASCMLSPAFVARYAGRLPTSTLRCCPRIRASKPIAGRWPTGCASTAAPCTSSPPTSIAARSSRKLR